MRNGTIKDVLVTTGKGLKKGAEIAIPILVSITLSKNGKRIINKIRYSGNVTYDDAIEAIMDDKDMYSSSRDEAIKLLRPNESSSYYRNVIRAVNSDTYASAKISMIKAFNEKLDSES